MCKVPHRIEKTSNLRDMQSNFKCASMMAQRMVYLELLESIKTDVFTVHCTWAGQVLGVSSTCHLYFDCTWPELQISLCCLIFPSGQWFKPLLRSILEHFVLLLLDIWQWWHTLLALHAQMGRGLCSGLRSPGSLVWWAGQIQK